MNDYLVVAFSDETRACQGVHALHELHSQGSVTVYGTAVVERDPDGTLAIKRVSDQGPLGTGVGALVGGLVGLFGGPVDEAMGIAAGGLAGSWREYVHAEVSDEFLEVVERELRPGTFAVVAEVSEDWVTPIDARMEALGGRAMREWREDFADDLLEKRAEARRAELAQRRAERAANAEGTDPKLSAHIGEVQARLHRTAERARERLVLAKEEMSAKLRALGEQAARADPDVRSRVEERIAALRKEFGEREAKLTRAYELTQDALHR